MNTELIKQFHSFCGEKTFEWFVKSLSQKRIDQELYNWQLILIDEFNFRMDIQLPRERTKLISIFLEEDEHQADEMLGDSILELIIKDSRKLQVRQET